MPEQDIVERFHDFVRCERCGKMVSDEYFDDNLNICLECLDELNEWDAMMGI